MDSSPTEILRKSRNSSTKRVVEANCEVIRLSTMIERELEGRETTIVPLSPTGTRRDLDLPPLYAVLVLLSLFLRLHVARPVLE
jgi:hypothetical protein